VPIGSRFKGYADYVVQELVIKVETTQYRVEKWRTPTGQIFTAELPAEVGDGDFGATLHNNLSEGDIREYVKRRKISGGTRSEDGRRCRDTFASLKKTCRKLPLGEGSRVRETCSSAAPVIVPRPQVVSHSKPSPQCRFLDTSTGQTRPCRRILSVTWRHASGH
jgi:hypothetical protein